MHVKKALRRYLYAFFPSSKAKKFVLKKYFSGLGVNLSIDSKQREPSRWPFGRKRLDMCIFILK